MGISSRLAKQHFVKRTHAFLGGISKGEKKEIIRLERGKKSRIECASHDLAVDQSGGFKDGNYVTHPPRLREDIHPPNSRALQS
ncbi:hypothetical protein CDAR_473051 [Caerostris darwini]|uniref:Uncharacterized protein n=1 Tax=Caerostris darwini TaxID=1538125 RepID=A0AAV4V9Y3_9ARAC|nr:hypothetical protein CDAR_473051 [Caerostris darwini]